MVITDYFGRSGDPYRAGFTVIAEDLKDGG